MAQGTERRQGASDSLVGASGITPVLPQAPTLQIPNASVPDVTNSMSAQVMRSVQGFASKQFQAQANVDHEASILDGQMAYQQGKAMEDLEVPGDKWAMQGYRVMNAQTTASTLLAAQAEMITQSQYEDDPDAFRATYVNRLEQQLDGLDTQTAKMVREQMADHMPTLVAQHTTAYMRNEEQKNFDALATQVGALSKDPTAVDALIKNATGAGAAGGLSQDRVDMALVRGVADAFNDGNPLAYQAMMESGAFDDLPATEREQVRGAKLRYENMKRSQVDGDFVLAQRNLLRSIDAGEYTGSSSQLTDDITAMYTSNGMEVRGAELGAAYVRAANVGDIENQTEYLSLQAAMLNGDTDKIVAGTADIVKQHDSGAVRMNNKTATRSLDLSPALMGTLESVLPSLGLTFEVFSGGQPIANGRNGDSRIGSERHDGGDAADGFFYKDGKRLDPQNSSADRVLVSEAISQLSAAGLTGFGSGEDYMQTGSVHLGFGDEAVWGKKGLGVNSAGWLATAVREPGVGGSGVAWADNVARYNGDVEAAALAHKTDQDTADAWLANGKSWKGIDSSAREYVEGIMTSVNGGDLYQTAAQRRSISQTKLESAKTLRDTLMKDSKEQYTLAAEQELTDRMRFSEKQLANGSMNGSQYQQVFDRKREALGLVRTSSHNSQIASSIDASITQAAERAEEAGDRVTAANLYAYEGGQASLTQIMKTAMSGAQTQEDMAVIGNVFQKESIALAREYGVDMTKTPLNMQHSQVLAEIESQTDRVEALAVTQARANAAIAAGTAAEATGDQAEAVDAALAQRVAQTVTENASVSDPEASMTPQEAQIKVWGEAGTVPTDARTAFSAAINGTLVVDGTPTPDALNAFETFKALRQNGSVAAANSMFDPKSRLRMEALILTTPGGISASAQQVSGAMIELDERSRNIQTQADLPDARNIGNALTTNEVANRAVDDFLDTNTTTRLEKWFTPSGFRNRNALTWKQTKGALSEENVEGLTKQIEDRFVQLRELNSGARDGTIAALAAEQILDEVSVIGDSVVSMNQGSGIKQQMFGDAASDFNTPLVEHKAIKGYIAMLAESDPDKYGPLMGTSALERSPATIQGFMRFFGTHTELSQSEAMDVVMGGGVRPFNVDENDGVNATISVLDRDGQREELDPAVFSMEAIGAWYMEAEHQRLMDENPDGGVLGAIDAWGNANIVEPLRDLVGSNN